MVIKLLHACGLSDSAFAHRCVKAKHKIRTAQVNEYSYYLDVEASVRAAGFQGAVRAPSRLWGCVEEPAGLLQEGVSC